MRAVMQFALCPLEILQRGAVTLHIAQTAEAAASTLAT